MAFERLFFGRLEPRHALGDFGKGGRLPFEDPPLPRVRFRRVKDDAFKPHGGGEGRLPVRALPANEVLQGDRPQHGHPVLFEESCGFQLVFELRKRGVPHGVRRLPVEMKEPHLQVLAVVEAIHGLGTDEFAVPARGGDIRMRCRKGARHGGEVRQGRREFREALHGLKGRIAIAGEEGERVRRPVPGDLKARSIELFGDDIADVAARALHLIFGNEVVKVFNGPPFVKEFRHDASCARGSEKGIIR